jgi:hypothetical protein
MKHMLKTPSRLSLAALSILVAYSPVAQGAVLAPGGTALIKGTNYPASVLQDVDRIISLLPDDCPVGVGCDPLPGLFLRDRVTQLGSGTVNFERLLRLQDFVPSVSGISTSESGFSGFTTDAEYDPSTLNGSTHPTQVDRSAGSGDLITFSNFSPDSLGAGQNSDFLTIQTDATAYALIGTVSVHVTLGAQGFHGDVPVFAPAVPEPASLASLLCCAALITQRRAHR